MKLSILAAPAFAEQPVGTWTGVVSSTKGERPILATITEQGGKLSARLESPLQAPGVPISTENVFCDGEVLSFASPMVGGSYSATWAEAQKAWVGVWKQNGADMPMKLTRLS